MSDPDRELRPRVLLSLQRALLGAVSPALRGVTCDWDEHRLRVRCLFDGPVTEADEEAMSVVGTELLADFPERSVDVECVRYDAPRPLSEEALRAWVYRRRE